MRQSHPWDRWLGRFPEENHVAASYRNDNSARKAPYHAYHAYHAPFPSAASGCHDCHGRIKAPYHAYHAYHAPFPSAASGCHDCHGRTKAPYHAYHAYHAPFPSAALLPRLSPQKPEHRPGGGNYVKGLSAFTQMCLSPVGKPDDAQVIKRYYQESGWLRVLVRNEYFRRKRKGTGPWTHPPFSELWRTGSANQIHPP